MSRLAIDNPNTLIAVYESHAMFDIKRIEASMGINWSDVSDYGIKWGRLYLKVNGEWSEAEFEADAVWEDTKRPTEILLVPERIEGGERCVIQN